MKFENTADGANKKVAAYSVTNRKLEDIENRMKELGASDEVLSEVRERKQEFEDFLVKSFNIRSVTR